MDPRQSAILHVLEKGEWFGGLPEDLRRAIVERSRLRRYGRGEPLRSEGLPPGGLGAVLEGEVGVTRWFDSEDHSLLHLGGPGFWFGELALLLRCETVVTIVAQTEVLALELSPNAFEQLVRERPDHHPHFARLALERYAILMRQVTELLGLDKEALLRTRLADLVDLRRSDDPQAHDEIRIPQSDLAALMGVSRQTLNELLRKLEADGSIEVSYRRIKVRDVTRLRGDQPRTAIFRSLRLLS